MLRSEERHQLHPGSFTKNIDCLAAFAITTGVVGNQPKPHTGKLFETVSLEHVDSCQHVGGDRGLSAGREPLQVLNEFGVVICRLRSSARHNVCVSNRRRNYRRHAASQWTNVAFTIRVNSIAEKDDKHLTRRINPDGCSGKTGMTERAKRKKVSPVA